MIHNQKIINDSKHTCAFLYPARNLPRTDPVRTYPYGYLTQPWTYCGAIKLLKQLKPAKESTVHDFILTENLANTLPALLVPDDVPYIDDTRKLDQPPLLNVENQKMSWQSYYPWLKDRLHFLSINPTHVTMRFKDTISDHIYAKTDLIILARGDFIHDGTEQLLVSNNVYKYSVGLEGDGSSIALYLLRRDKKSQTLEVLYPENYLFSQCDVWLSNKVKK